MSSLSYIEREIVDELFNRGGYVLDFSTERFDSFTNDSVGIKLCEFYRLSKGKSLWTFMEEGPDDQVIKLLGDLIEYYSRKFQKEMEEESTFAMLFEQSNHILNSLKNRPPKGDHQLEQLKDKFRTPYIEQQISTMQDCIETNPTDAIGKAKELLETCCKTILKLRNISFEKDWDVPKLSKTVCEVLKLTPDDIDDSIRASEIIKKILGNLGAICGGMAELRNDYGSGHGKEADYKGLSPRHARLAVGASATTVYFLWETFLEQTERND